MGNWVGRLAKIEREANPSTLWGDCRSIATFCAETWGGVPAPDTRRLQQLALLSAAPALLTSEVAEHRRRGHDLLGLDAAVEHGRAEIDTAAIGLARAAGFTRGEIEVLRLELVRTHKLLTQITTILGQDRTNDEINHATDTRLPGGTMGAGATSCASDHQ